MKPNDQFDGSAGSQSPRQQSQASALPAQSATHPTSPLWNEAQTAAFYGVSARKFHEMRGQGLVPEPIVLGPRALRWVPEECAAAARQMPRAAKLNEPTQLARARIERMKGAASAPRTAEPA